MVESQCVSGVLENDALSIIYINSKNQNSASHVQAIAYSDLKVFGFTQLSAGRAFGPHGLLQG
jgi:hypothetical protein